MRNTHGILVPVVILLCIGIIMVYSSSAFMSTEKYGNSFHYVWKHLFTVLIGFMGMIFFVKLDYQDIKKFVIPLLVFSFILLILVFVPGIGMSAGAKSTVKRWINMRLLTFQPSELVKIARVIFLSKYRVGKSSNSFLTSCHNTAHRNEINHPSFPSFARRGGRGGKNLPKKVFIE